LGGDKEVGADEDDFHALKRKGAVGSNYDRAVQLALTSGVSPSRAAKPKVVKF
jgi:hypothetical protein